MRAITLSLLLLFITSSGMASGKQERPAPPRKVDPKTIPMGDALLLGSEKARVKVVVLTDPECPSCKRLHPELIDVVKRDPEIAFLIKLYPLAIHPNSYQISKSIVCSRSMALLEKAFDGKAVPRPNCATTVVDETIAFAKRTGISGTPTLILGDGSVAPGFRRADDLLKLLKSR